MASPKILQFAPFSSALDTGFWHKLSQLKLDVYGLDDNIKHVHGFYSNGNADGLPCRMNLDYTAFDDAAKTPPRNFPAHGILKNTNTMDDFKDCDKKQFIDSQSSKLWDDIKSGAAIENPALLSTFTLLTFADLKKYYYYYWFAFPALTAPETFEIIDDAKPMTGRFSDSQVTDILSFFDTECLPKNIGYFLAQETASGGIACGSLGEFDALSNGGNKVILCVCDPCTLDKHPGWPVRNLLTLAAFHWAEKLGHEVEVLCLRDRFKDGKRSVEHSRLFRTKLSSIADYTECPKCVGWEKNERQKLGPRMVNLSSSMDPVRLAGSAVDLNLKLMRWRLMPDLDLEKVSSTRCLLLGSGTLGCNVGRALMAWGVRTITFVDNGKISYSNPVRQSLFKFEDSLNGGKPKAETAAAALKEIFPGLNATGHSFSIPMPGHAVSEGLIAQVKEDVQKLENLIDNHDVVFLLMDTRESRWLPTLLGCQKRKIVMNAALGFDTFLVVRHGVRAAEAAMEVDSKVTGAAALSHSEISGTDLGCYFCNDVVAPGDSTKDRTLDQQCTVSRPGMSMLAGALAVELLVSILVHPDGGRAAADTSSKDEHLTKDSESPLGLVPHQIRGFLSRYHNVMPASRTFDKCTACSDTVIKEYEKNGFDFLLRSFNEPKYLEDLSGLSQLHADTADIDIWEMSDEDDI